MINSIGLPNKGLDGYLAEDLPLIAGFRSDPAAGLRGDAGACDHQRDGLDAEDLARLVEACDARSEIAAIELNVSCPNVATGLDIGADPAELERVLAAVRPRTGKPLIVKLTPNAADVPACALGAQAGGADAVSLINTLRAAAMDPGGSGRPWLGGGTGGLSGPAIRAVALAQVAAVAAARRNSCHRDGRRSALRARPRAARRGCLARRCRHRELPRSGRRHPDRRRACSHGVKTPANTGPAPSSSLDPCQSQLEV